MKRLTASSLFSCNRYCWIVLDVLSTNKQAASSEEVVLGNAPETEHIKATRKKYLGIFTLPITCFESGTSTDLKRRATMSTTDTVLSESIRTFGPLHFKPVIGSLPSGDENTGIDEKTRFDEMTSSILESYLTDNGLKIFTADGCNRLQTLIADTDKLSNMLTVCLYMNLTKKEGEALSRVNSGSSFLRNTEVKDNCYFGSVDSLQVFLSVMRERTGINSNIYEEASQLFGLREENTISVCAKKQASFFCFAFQFPAEHIEVIKYAGLCYKLRKEPLKFTNFTSLLPDKIDNASGECVGNFFKNINILMKATGKCLMSDTAKKCVTFYKNVGLAHTKKLLLDVIQKYTCGHDLFTNNKGRVLKSREAFPQLMKICKCKNVDSDVTELLSEVSTLKVAISYI